MESNINCIIEDDSLILFHSYNDVQDIKDQIPYKIEQKNFSRYKKSLLKYIIKLYFLENIYRLSNQEIWSYLKEIHFINQWHKFVQSKEYNNIAFLNFTTDEYNILRFYQTEYKIHFSDESFLGKNKLDNFIEKVFKDSYPYQDI